jgi:diguanylate cyclase (GGDEF)-like protein/PAS domain S-box-containing protein
MVEKLRQDCLLSAILATTEEAVLGIDLGGNIVRWSRGAERLYGYARDEVLNRPLAQLMPIYEVAAFEEMLERVRHGESLDWELVERLNRDGTRRRMTVRLTPIPDEAGRVTGVLEAGRLLEWSGSNVPSDVQLRLVAEQMPGLVWITDQNLRITANWGTGLPGTKIRPGSLIGKNLGEFLEAADRYACPLAQHYDALHGEASRFECQRQQRTLEVQVVPLRASDGKITGCIGVASDVTHRKKTEEQIRYQATHDGLTGLANYRAFVDTLEREGQRADRGHHSFAVLLLDLDDLKAVNDRLGHLEGNRALKRVAAILKDQCRSTDLAARYGGDEFGIVLIDSDLGMAEHVLRRVEASLEKDSQEPRLTVSIGIGVFPDDGRTAQEILQAADRQLYLRKKSSRERRSVALP